MFWVIFWELVGRIASISAILLLPLQIAQASDWFQQKSISFKLQISRFIVFLTLFFIVFAVGADICIRLGLMRPSFEFVHDLTYADQEVPIDGKEYSHCVFRNVTFVIDGQPGKLTLQDNKFEGERAFETNDQKILTALKELNSFGVIHLDKNNKILSQTPSIKGP